jgi:hypothetical protein
VYIGLDRKDVKRMAKCEVKVYSIVCDECGDSFDGTDGDGCPETGYINNMRDVVRGAKAVGWRTGHIVDTCPKCAKKYDFLRTIRE